MERDGTIEGDSVVDVEWLDRIARIGEPYEGPIKQPVTLLDKMIYETLKSSPNDNELRPADPYDRHPKRLINAGVEVMDRDGRLAFGEDYIIARTPLRRNDVATVRCVYNKQYGRGRVIIDDFETAQGGGLASRTFFSSQEGEPERITKTRQTDFHSYLGQVGLGVFIDFSRPLKSAETETLRKVLGNTFLLYEPVANATPSNAKLKRLFGILVGESKSEARLKQRNRKAFDIEMEEHRRAMEDIHEKVIMPRRPIPGPRRWLS
jgi:hypothetical protein